MTGIFWPMFWAGEFIVWVGGALAWFVPMRKSQQCSKSAKRLHEMAVVASSEGQPHEQVDTLFQMSQREWIECFEWHALTRRIHRITVPASAVLFALTLIHLGVAL